MTCNCSRGWHFGAFFACAGGANLTQLMSDSAISIPPERAREGRAADRAGGADRAPAGAGGGARALGGARSGPRRPGRRARGAAGEAEEDLAEQPYAAVAGPQAGRDGGQKARQTAPATAVASGLGTAAERGAGRDDQTPGDGRVRTAPPTFPGRRSVAAIATTTSTCRRSPRW